MTGPDRIWAWPWEVNPRMGQWSDAQEIVGDGNEYIRRDPAVLAALPEVQAMIAAAYEVAAKVVDTCNAEGPYQSIGAAGRIRALTPSDAAAALARIVREAEARGMVKGMREAATLLREQGYGTAPKQILARAAEIERDGK